MPSCVKARRSRCRNCRCRPILSGNGKVVYEAISDGWINVERLRAVWVNRLLAEKADDEPIKIAVDATNIERRSAPTSADRGMIHLSTLPLVGKPISIGWMFATVVL